MWTDLAAQLWPALPLFFLAGCCFVLGGFIWLVAIRRHDALGPLPAKLADPPARIDADTAVIPRIPGATVELGPVAAYFLDAGAGSAESALTDWRIPPYMPALADPPPDGDEVVHDEIIIGPLRQVDGPSDEVLERLAARLRTADVGPVCPTCGGPWHAVCPAGPKSAPRDDCPLTTDEIRIPTRGETPAFTATVERADTRDLTVPLAKILEATK